MSRIDEIKARCAAATEEPWNEFRDGKEWCIESDDHIVLTAGQDHGQGLVLIGQNDVDFIVNARGDLPWAVSEIERLTAALARPDKCPLMEVEDEDTDTIETPEACPFCYFYDIERELCMNRDSPCCGQWIKDITFGCNLFEASEQAVEGRSPEATGGTEER